MCRPIHDLETLTGMERQFTMQHFTTMQGENDRLRKRGFLPSSASQWGPEWAMERGNSFAKVSYGDKNGSPEAAAMREAVLATDVPLSDLAHDDEMVSWLHYPLDDTFDRNYCTEELFDDLPDPHHLHLSSKDSSRENQASHSHGQQPAFLSDSNCRGPAFSSSPQVVGPLASSECSLMGSNGSGKAVTADTAMALGAGRAAGLLPQAGAEAFSKTRTSVQPSLAKGTHTDGFLPQTPRDFSSPGASLQPLKPSDNSTMSPHSLRSSAFNFAQFTRPVAATMTSLQFVAGSSGPTNAERARQPFVVPAKGGGIVSSSQPCAAECSATVRPGVGSSRQPDLNPHGTETRQCTGSSSQREQRLPPPLQQRRQQVDAGQENEKLCDRSGTSLSGSATTASERGNGTVDTADFGTTLASRGSGNCIAKSVQEVAASSPKKSTRFSEESENRSEEVEEVAANAKKPPSGRASSSKRARAAEIHNQSERRRRDKINDRMKALQELIPNANKTDKASMLDEVIEYLKMLQGQLQLMSMRTGMLVPPTMMPTGIQYLPMQQMPALPHMGVGMGMGMGMGLGMGVGMGMGMGMGMMDVSSPGAGAGAVRAVVPLPGLPGQFLPATAYHPAGFQPGSSSSVIPEVQGAFHTSRVMNEHYNAFPAQQQPQPMQLNMQANVDMYNAFMQQQRQGNSSSKAIQ